MSFACHFIEFAEVIPRVVELRPSIKEAKQMPDYQLILYIKNYIEFNNNYKH